MEGLGGVGTGEMVRSGGKDYAVGRELATNEVNAVVEAILAQGYPLIRFMYRFVSI